MSGGHLPPNASRLRRESSLMVKFRKGGITVKKGKIIAIEAGDASGKATQARLLFEKLKEIYLDKVHLISFPRYSSESSFFVREYLSGNFGNLSEIGKKEAALFYAMDRYASYHKEWKELYESGDVFVMDRYVPSNIVHQAAKDMEDENTNQLSDSQRNFCDWVENLEYRILNLPAPDAVIFLDMDIDASLRLLEERAKENKREKDIHEKNTDYLRKVHRCYQLFAKEKEWFRIHCCDTIGNISPIEEIQAWVLALSRNVLARD